MKTARPTTRIALAGLLLAAACGSSCFFARTRVNEPLPTDVMSQLESGMLANDVLMLLGAPQEVVEIGDRSAYRFEFAKTKRTGLFLVAVGLYNDDTRSDRIWVFFDANDRLTHAAGRFEANDVEYALPFNNVDD